MATFIVLISALAGLVTIGGAFAYLINLLHKTATATAVRNHKMDEVYEDFYREVIPIKPKIELVFSEVLGDGSPENPGLRAIAATVHSHDSDLKQIKYELSSNSGHSIKDAVRRTESSVQDIKTQLLLVSQRQDFLEDRRLDRQEHTDRLDLQVRHDLVERQDLIDRQDRLVRKDLVEHRERSE
jgi:hypothetical protein